MSATTSIFNLTAFTALATGDVIGVVALALGGGQSLRQPPLAHLGCDTGLVANTPRADRGALTDNAGAPAVSFHLVRNKVPFVRVPLGTVRHVLQSRVGGGGERLKMCRIAAVTRFAGVVQMGTIWNRSHEEFVRDAMDSFAHAALPAHDLKDPVPRGIRRSGPQPAMGCNITDSAAEKSDFKRDMAHARYSMVRAPMEQAA